MEKIIFYFSCFHLIKFLTKKKQNTEENKMAYLDDIDQRQFKKGRFGPLDVFQQEEKQKEVSV